MSPVNSMFVCIKKKIIIIGKSVFKMADIDNRSTPNQDGTTSEKTLFAGLYIIWIISQQQQLCLILLHKTE